MLAQLAEDVGDEDFVRETVQVFLDELPGRVGAITAGARDGDPAAVRAGAHSLKSSAGMLGAVNMARICRDIEAVADPDDGVTDAAVQACGELAVEEDAVAAEFRGYLSETM